MPFGVRRRASLFGDHVIHTSRRSVSLKNRLTLFVAVAVAGAKAYGAGGGPMAVGTLRQQADVVAIATVESLANSPEAETLQLQVVKALQGQPASLSLTA